MAKLTVSMIEELNKQIKRLGSSVQYVKDYVDGETVSYRAIVDDPFIDNNTRCLINLHPTFEWLVRNHLAVHYGVEKTGYSNTVNQLFAVMD